MSQSLSAGEWRDTKFVVLSVVLMLAVNVPASIFSLGWKAAMFNTALWTVIYGVYIWRSRSTYLLGLAIFGLAAGFTELLADWWLVTRTESLVYAPGEPMLVVSPLYMPFAWAQMLLQVGVIAGWLRTRMPAVAAALLTGLFGGLNIPLYEHLARDADWWFYRATPMIAGAPYYIILGEFLLALPLVWVLVGLKKMGPVAGGLGLGVLEGLVILAAYMIAWWLVGPCSGAVIQFACS